MVAILATYGAASLEPAYSFLGHLLSWVAKHMPESDAIHGTEYGVFLNSIPPFFRPDFFVRFFPLLPYLFIFRFLFTLVT